MRTISQLLLTLLLNACWQIALIAGASSVCAWLLRGTAIRYRHWLWVSALALSFGLPLVTTSQVFRSTFLASQPAAIEPVEVSARLPQLDSLKLPTPFPDTRAPIGIDRNLAAGLIGIYLLLFLYRGRKLFQAWKRTRGVISGARPIEFHEGLAPVVERCEVAIGVTRVRILSSDSVPVPLTVGVRKPIVILPQQLLREADVDVLTSAVGHEFVHVWRRDYLLNLIYELVFLPLAFHPGAALIRRRINQTRELCCDELVAEKLLDAEVYARSLVQLAGSAPPLRPLAATTTVGIADADILEVRIMSLLKRSKASLRQKKLLLIAATIVLIVPCVAAASFALNFNIDPQDLKLSQSQEPSPEAKEKKENEARETRSREGKVEFKGDEYEVGFRLGQQEKEMKERAERDPQFKAELEARSRRQQEEREAKAIANSTLAGLAKISMDQAILIATSQQPGKVLECSLVGEHWESPGKLAKDGLVIYHVVILPSEGTSTATVSGRDGQTYTVNLASVHVLVNAVDGSIFRTSKEERGKEPNK